MRVKIYQIDSNRDPNHCKFMSMDWLLQHERSVDASIYDEAFNAVIDEEDPEDIFRRFNTEGHPLHRGHSLSVSDVVVLVPDESPEAVGEIRILQNGSPEQRLRYADLVAYNAKIIELTDADIDFEAHDLHGLHIPVFPKSEPKAFFCDRIGFKPILFDEAKAQKPEDLMRVVYVEPNKPPYEAEIQNKLEAEQQAVGGLIELVYNEDDTIIVCNEEAKLNGMKGNRRIGDGSTIIAGPFFICGDDGENFRGLTDDEVMQYMEAFAEPEEISAEEVEADTGFIFYSF